MVLEALTAGVEEEMQWWLLEGPTEGAGGR